MNTFLMFFCCTIIAASAQDSNDEGYFYEPPCICPDDPVEETDDCILNNAKKKYIKNLWTKPSMILEGKQDQMKNVLLKMAEVDYPLWRQIAFVNTVWLSNYLVSADETPSLCAFAQMINATVAWETSKDGNALSDALGEIAATLHNYVTAAGDNAVRAAGCTVSIPNKFRNHTCYENGLVYDIDQIWEINGGLMPIAYEKATKALYNSSSYTDRLMAIMATGSITKPLQDIATEFNSALVIQFLHLENMKPIPSCCCKRFTENLNTTYEIFKDEAVKTTDGIKLRTLNTTVCESPKLKNRFFSSFVYFENLFT